MIILMIILMIIIMIIIRTSPVSSDEDPQLHNNHGHPSPTWILYNNTQQCTIIKSELRSLCTLYDTKQLEMNTGEANNI